LTRLHFFFLEKGLPPEGRAAVEVTWGRVNLIEKWHKEMKLPSRPEYSQGLADRELVFTKMLEGVQADYIVHAPVLERELSVEVGYHGRTDVRIDIDTYEGASVVHEVVVTVDAATSEVEGQA
jgi:hypothetical protein